MFCSNCGKEIANDSNVCGYCGTPVQGNVQNGGNMGNTQGYSNQVNNDQQYYSGQPNYNNQQYNNGQPNYNVPQQYNNGQGYNNQQYSGGEKFKPDNKFNIVAGLFTWIWALAKGMWDLALVDIGKGILITILTFSDPFGAFGNTLSFVYGIASFVFVGRNANYYYRLKETQKISMFKAIQDPNLRRL